MFSSIKLNCDFNFNSGNFFYHSCEMFGKHCSKLGGMDQLLFHFYFVKYQHKPSSQKRCLSYRGNKSRDNCLECWDKACNRMHI